MPFNELVGMEETDILFDIIVEMNKGNLNPFNRFRWGSKLNHFCYKMLTFYLINY